MNSKIFILQVLSNLFQVDGLRVFECALNKVKDWILHFFIKLDKQKHENFLSILGEY